MRADYYVVGQCTGAGDLDELPYTLTVDGEEVSQGSISCRDGIVTKNSGFAGTGGRQRVSVRFAAGAAANGYAEVRPG